MSFVLETPPKINRSGEGSANALRSPEKSKGDVSPVVDSFDSQDLLGTCYVICKVIIQELYKVHKGTDR